MKLGLSAGNMLPFVHLEKIMEVAAKFVLGLEIFPYRKLDREALHQKSIEYQIPIYGIHATYWWDVVGYQNYYRHCPSFFSRAFTKVLKRTLGNEQTANSIDFAKIVRARYINYHPDVFNRLLFTGNRNTIKNVRPLIENDGGLIWNFRDMIDLAKTCSIGITLDTSHTALEGLGLIEATDLCGSLLANIHFSDGKDGIDLHGVPGLGTLDLTRFLRRLETDGFTEKTDTFIIIELTPPLGNNTHKFEQKIGDTVNFIRNIIE